MDSIAKQIAKLIDADLFRIDNAQNDEFRGYYYTHIVFGSPVVKGSIASPIREFIQKNKDELYKMTYGAFMWREKRHWGDSFKELENLISPIKAEMIFTGELDSRVDVFCELLRD